MEARSIHPDLAAHEPGCDKLDMPGLPLTPPATWTYFATAIDTPIPKY